MSRLPRSVSTIGAGNMAEALLRGLLRAGMQPEQLRASDPDAARRAYLANELGIRVAEDNVEVVADCELAVVAVKPGVVEAALRDLPAAGGPLYVSIAAGRAVSSLRAALGSGARIVRAMPNTPALISAGISAIAEDTGASEADLELAEAVLGAIGRVLRVPESQMDAVTGLSGSGPAYVYLFVEALTEAGVREGLSVETAHELALETALGAARLVRESGERPAVLRDRVTSPGGTTIAGLAALEQEGFRAALLAAVRAATARSRELAGDP
ncbi:MAG: pyrroline-5-carboxylate reductase [Myxococcota bacterium]